MLSGKQPSRAAKLVSKPALEAVCKQCMHDCFALAIVAHAAMDQKHIEIQTSPFAILIGSLSVLNLDAEDHMLLTVSSRVRTKHREVSFGPHELHVPLRNSP